MRNNEIDSREYKGFKIKIWHDEYSDDPRSWDNRATFVCEHSRYSLGDEHDIDSAINELFDKYATSEDIIAYFVNYRKAKITEDEGKKYEYSWGERTFYIDAEQPNDDIAAEMADDLSTMEKLHVASKSGNFVWQPISIYDHSGVSIWLGSTKGHVDARWDCSTIGFAYMEKSTAEKEYVPTEEYKTWQAWAIHVMEAEMSVYDQYVSGECYGWSILDEHDDVIELCGGYYGSNYNEKFKECESIVDSYIESREKEHIDRIRKISEFLLKNIHIGEKFYIFGYLYSIGKDMFGNAVLERAKVVKNRFLPLEPYNTKDLDMESAETLLQCLERLKTA